MHVICTASEFVSLSLRYVSLTLRYVSVITLCECCHYVM